MRIAALLLSLAVPLAFIPQTTLAQEAVAEDTAPGLPFKEGDVISFETMDKLKDYLPPQFWEHREYFFYEGMEIKIGPVGRDYTPSAAYQDMTNKQAGVTKLGKDGALLDYRGGQPFKTEDIDCKGDPDAGAKIAWNFVKRWSGDGSDATWSYTYWDRGDQLPLYYKGTAKAIMMAKRVEPKFEPTGGDIFKNERRGSVFGIEVKEPFDARGILLLTYSYKSADLGEGDAKNDDTWVYVPDLRRTRRISRAQRTDSVQGTDFTMDDLNSFAGKPPQYLWECLGEATIIAPVNTQSMAYPYNEDYNFGPYGFSFANDQWEVRDAWIIRFDPRNDDHPYAYKDIYVDKQATKPLYSFAYDRRKELWKIIWHNTRWSEDWHEGDERAKGGDWYPGWEGVDEPRDLRIVSDIIVNVQTGTGNRIEYWDSHGKPFSSRGKIRRYIDIGRLNKGR
jgi:hypothetical protein